MSKNKSPSRLVALQYRDFRLFWFGRLVSTIGSRMQLIAINWHIFELLRGSVYTMSIFGRDLSLGAEALGLGTLGLVRVIPIVIFALFGGILADMYDRRKLLLLTQTASAVFAGVLAVITFTGNDSVAAIYLLTAAGAAATAMDNPARQSLVPHLVPREYLTNAISLTTLLWQLGTIIGPGIAGVMVARFSLGVVYAINAGSFAAVLVALLLMEYRGSAAAADAAIDVKTMVEGMRFVYNSRIIWSTMLVDFFATLFSSARTMLPIVASDILGVGVEGYGILATAQPIGAVIAGAIVSMRRDIYHQGAVLLISVAVYGMATALFGISTVFALSYVLFALTGAGDTVSTVIRGTIRQIMTPDHLRGRMVSINMVFFMGGPQLGELEAGLVAAVFGAPIAIFTGGVATVLLTLLVAWRYPRLRTYTSETAKEMIDQTAARQAS